MIKVCWLLTFRSDLDLEDVRRWWRTDHGDLALKVPGLKRYVQNHFLGAIDEARAEGGMPFQGLVEVWKALEDDGINGFDMTVLYGGFVREHVMRWDAVPDGRFYTSAGDIPDS
jgi:EthD domain